MTAPTAVQASVDRTSSSNTTTYVVTPSRGVTTGGLLVVFFAVDDNSLITYTSGSHRVNQDTNTNISCSVCCLKYATGSNALAVTSDTDKQSYYVVYRLNNASPYVVKTTSNILYVGMGYNSTNIRWNILATWVEA